MGNGERQERPRDLSMVGRSAAKIIDSIPIGMHMYRLDVEGNLIFCGSNPAAERILGVESSGLVGKTLEDAFPRLAETEMPERFRLSAREGRRSRTDKIVYKDGSVKGAFEVLTFRTGKGEMVAAYIDVTKRRQDEDEFRKQAENLERLIETRDEALRRAEEKIRDERERAGDSEEGRQILALTLLDLADRLTSGTEVADAVAEVVTELGKMTCASRAYFCRLRHGGSSLDVDFEWCADDEEPRVSDLQGIPLGDHPWPLPDLLENKVVHEVNLHDLPADALGRESFEAVETSSVLMVPLRVAGEVRAFIGFDDPGEGAWIDDDFALMRLAASILGSALQRESVERETKEKDARYRAFVEQSSDAILVHRDGRVVHANPAALEFFSLTTPKAIVGKPVYGFIHPDHHDSERRRVRRVFVKGASRETVEQRVLRSDGGVVFAETIAAPIVFEGEPAVQVIYRDITERKNLEEAILTTARLESLGTVAAGVAHDFNNLLTAILGNLSLAEIDAGGQGRVGRRLRDARKAVEEARHLTTQLLRCTNAGLPVTRTIAVEGLVKQSVDLVLSGSPANARLSFAEGLWPVRADEEQFSQVIRNLTLNAMQAMPRGGTVSVACDNTRIEAKRGLPLTPGRYVRVSVRDEGTGMTREQLERALDPYFTTKREASGLGLSTASAIVRRHEGYLSIESTPGKGTTVDVYLPASDEEPDAADEGAGVPMRARILVMDDEEMVREVAGEMLESLGYEVDFARHGEEALEKSRVAKESGRAYDGFVLDLTISGGMGGEDAVRQILEIDPEAKVIVSSGYSEHPVMMDFTQYGFEAKVAKPYSLAELGDTVARVVKH